jgi:carbonic anhydrase
MPILDLLEQNRKWAASQLAADPDFFRRHVAGQSPRAVMISCCDSRVPVEQVLGCGLGELFVHRNIANQVAANDINLAAVLHYAIEHLKVEDVLVCGHYECGGVAAVCAETAAGGPVGDWLLAANVAKKRVDDRIARQGTQRSHKEYLRLAVEENVKLQVEHLSHLAIIRHGWKDHAGIPRLHGWVYDIGTGIVKVVTDVVMGPIATRDHG